MAQLVGAAEAAAGLARELAPETERARQLPAPLVAALREPGLLRAGVPAALGGPELAPAEMLGAAEAVARGDASAGWCVSIAATSSLLSAWLDPEGAAEVFGDPGAVAAGVWAPRGTAVPENGGYRVSGRWGFCSGITHSDWLFAGCRLPSETLLIAGLPRAELEVEDTWHVGGLRGTGSHHAVARDVLVPAAHTLDLFAPPVQDAALYRFPPFGFFALSIGAAALGNARGALDDAAAAVATDKRSVQGALARAEAELRAARALFYAAIADGWAAAQRPEPPPADVRAGLRLAAGHAVHASAGVVRAVYELAGSHAVYESSPLGRRFRDAHTATAHVQVSPGTWELVGRVLLGEPADTTQL